MIEQTIHHVMSSVPAVWADGWLDDAAHYFCGAKGWTKAAAFKRDQADCLLELKGIVSPSISDLRNLRRLQEGIWQELASPYFEASSLTFYKEASVLRFITAPNNLSCLTGRMVIGGNHYYELVREKFNSLKSAPFHVDFADLEEYVLSASEAQERNRIANEADHKQRVAAAIQTVDRISDYTLTAKEEDIESPLLRDALSFNLQQLYRQCLHFEHRRFAGFREWRARVRATPGFNQKPGSVDASLIWHLAVTEAPEFRRLIENSDRK